MLLHFSVQSNPPSQEYILDQVLLVLVTVEVGWVKLWWVWSNVLVAIFKNLATMLLVASLYTWLPYSLVKYYIQWGRGGERRPTKGGKGIM